MFQLARHLLTWHRGTSSPADKDRVWSHYSTYIPSHAPAMCLNQQWVVTWLQQQYLCGRIELLGSGHDYQEPILPGPLARYRACPIPCERLRTTAMEQYANLHKGLTKGITPSSRRRCSIFSLLPYADLKKSAGHRTFNLACTFTPLCRWCLNSLALSDSWHMDPNDGIGSQATSQRVLYCAPMATLP